MTYLGEFEQLILFSIVALGDQAYGVAIRESIEERTGRAVSSGSIYTALGRMQERGLVSSRVERAGEGPGRPRKLYELQPAGSRALLSAWDTMQSMAAGLVPRLERMVEAADG